jgi:uncharacterized protein (DUF433 family)
MDLIAFDLRHTMTIMKRVRNSRRTARRVELGQYVVADPDICHGQPTFKGTRIMVWQVLDDLADGRSWEFICNKRWGGRIPLAAVAEAVRLARAAWLDKPPGASREPLAA